MLAIVASLILSASLLGVAPAPAADTPHVKHSGTVVAVDAQRGVLVLAEVGPWRLDHGETVVTRRTIVLTPATKVDALIRVSVPGGFVGDFLEVPLDAADLTPGDFVTVDCLHERGRLVALRVSVAELD
ncbi:MAG TPA: hypothetical protein VFL90_21365 [Methylomirabilota bacterium]|nr:hypothetical protein [Methylomirabilota bacterium]